MSTALGFKRFDIRTRSLRKNQKFSYDPMRSFESFPLDYIKVSIFPQTFVVNKTF